MDDALGFAVTVGNKLTAIVVVAILVQPFTSVPITVYIEVAVGTNPVPSITPPLQV
jgi:hypothetical protein